MVNIQVRRNGLHKMLAVDMPHNWVMDALFSIPALPKTVGGVAEKIVEFIRENYDTEVKPVEEGEPDIVITYDQGSWWPM